MTAPFGKALRDQFLFEDGWRNLNHGSFGTYPRAIRDKLRDYQDRAELQPDTFIRYDGPKLIDESRAAVAELVRAPGETVTFVQNATTGINTVLRALRFEEGDHILYCDTIYGACEKTVQYICETTPARAVKFEYHHPIEDQELIERFEAEIVKVAASSQGRGKVKVAIFDTVSSIPGLCVPWEALTVVCKKHQILSLVDAAHAVGMLDLDLPKTDPDFFVSNCHKWVYTPRGCAMVYVPLRNQHLIRSTLPTSHGFVPLDPGLAVVNPLPAGVDGKSAYLVNFEFVGTLDNAPYMCVKDAIRWRRETLGGEEEIRKYCFGLAKEAADRIASILGTTVLTNESKTLQDCCLFNIRLPLSFDADRKLLPSSETSTQESPSGNIPAATSTVSASDIIAWMPERMTTQHKTFIPIFWYRDALWARFSAQAYLDIDDFVWGGELLKELCRVVESEGVQN